MNKLLMYRDMIYPQYEDRFDKLLYKGEWEFVQREARKRLEKPGWIYPEMKKHCEDIVSGKVPFGYKVRDK